MVGNLRDHLSPSSDDYCVNIWYWGMWRTLKDSSFEKSWLGDKSTTFQDFSPENITCDIQDTLKKYLFYGGATKWLTYRGNCNELWERWESYCTMSADHIAFSYFKMHRCTGNEGFETNVRKRRRKFLIHGTLTIFMWYYGNMVIPSNLSLNS